MKKSDPKSMAGRPSEKSKQLGQIFTPASIASRMVEHLLNSYQNEEVQILDPCVGPCTFPQMISSKGLLSFKQVFTTIDIDQEMVSLTNEWALNQEANLQCINADYLELPMEDKYDYAILNPPYVRQEWLDKKHYYQKLFKERYRLSVPGTSNLYVYFLIKVIMDLKPRGQFVCIVYDSWQSTQYGRWLLAFLKSSCDLLQVEAVSNQPFNDRLIDATIIRGVKKLAANIVYAPLNASQSEDTQGIFFDVSGFSSIQDIFSTQRGLRLKQADFFLSDISMCATVEATPFLKKVGKFKGYCVPRDHSEAALLITSKKEKPLVLAELQKRIECAEKKPDKNVSILTWLRERPDSWFLHREAPYAPILFNYYLRNRPKHIFNPDRRYADNFYGLLPINDVSPLAYFAVLNSTAVCADIMSHARNQGNGLAKIQLFEYRRVHLPNLSQCSEKERTSFHTLGLDLVERPHLSETTFDKIDDLIASIFDDPRLRPSRIKGLFDEADWKARRPKEIGACLG